MVSREGRGKTYRDRIRGHKGIFRVMEMFYLDHDADYKTAHICQKSSAEDPACHMVWPKDFKNQIEKKATS